MDREKIINDIKLRVSVCENNEWEFPGSGATMIELADGNKFYIDKLRIDADQVKVVIYNRFFGEIECSIQYLIDESLALLLNAIPEVKTLFIEAFSANGSLLFTVYTQPVSKDFSELDMEAFVKQNFPLLHWESDSLNHLFCYTERTDKTGPYLWATLLDLNDV